MLLFLHRWSLYGFLDSLGKHEDMPIVDQTFPIEHEKLLGLYLVPPISLVLSQLYHTRPLGLAVTLRTIVRGPIIKISFLPPWSAPTIEHLLESPSTSSIEYSRHFKRIWIRF
ncbi:hypothetical protein Fmac_023378 [Flemingia macrophylla]|uniref:Uncharacterized protein n=1 Tax=Flemingia macrophylla TaxID=520843 RepID=A0ABD1LMY6_9FABA